MSRKCVSDGFIKWVEQAPINFEVVTERCSIKEVFCSVKNFFTAILRDTEYDFQNHVLQDKLDGTLMHLKKRLAMRFDVFF